MSFEMARKIANAVLYEGYVLYPYRPSSLKNQFRWQFGVVAPRSWDGDPSFMQTECLIEPDGSPVVDVTVRFLQVHPKTSEWDEGIERTVDLLNLALDRDYEQQFEFAPLRGIIRIHVERALACHDRLSSRARAGFEKPAWQAQEPAPHLKLRIRIENLSDAVVSDRNEAMRHSLAGTHTLLSVTGGAFVSAIDSPECENVHTWPVLVGKPGARDVMLSSPIILEDYPSVAPESPGDFFDGTEIDEMLTLRVMTMTDEEKREASATDERARRVIERCENMPRETFERLHGAIRSIGEDFFNPEDEVPETQSITVGTATISRGSRVRLAPRRNADSMDMFLAGRTARVASVHHDVEDRVYVAVSVEDDPSTEIYGRFFYFYPEELEPIEKEN
jgi:hypothetical protein